MVKKWLWLKITTKKTALIVGYKLISPMSKLCVLADFSSSVLACKVNRDMQLDANLLRAAQIDPKTCPHKLKKVLFLKKRNPKAS